MEYTILDTLAYDMYCKEEGRNKETGEYYPLHIFEDFVEINLNGYSFNNYYLLVKNKMRKEKLKNLEYKYEL